MTDETKTPEDEPKDENAETKEGSEQSSEAPKSDTSKWNPVEPQDNDPLPDLIERTPEYVEEEAQRADFVLRWAIVLLAMMLGFTKPDESQTAALVHAKSGEYMQSNGFLPPGKDVLSYTAEGQDWIQLSWLFDHVSAFANSIMGDIGFTVISALFAAIAFGYAVHTAIPRLSTWWTSICVAGALFTCFPRFTATPEILTLAFSSITVAWLYRWQSTEDAGFPWKIPVLFVIWSNCDPYMWIGVLLVALYAVGHAIDKVLGRKGWTLPGKSGQVWVLLGLCVAGSVCNPFIHQSLLQPTRIYGTEYPAMRTESPLRESNAENAPEWVLQSYGLMKPEVWMTGQKTIYAGAIVLLIALGAFIVNLKHQDTGYFLMLLGLIGLTLFGCHELAVASLIAAMLAGLNGQDWFRNNFKTDYTTDTKTFVFSQGGRAITVIAFAAFAFLGVSGRLTGPEGVRIGAGFDANLKATLAGMEKALEDTEEDARLFNFKRSQGDMLIWLNRKSFIDSRVGLFGEGEDSIAATHRATRSAFRVKRTGSLGSGDTRLVNQTVKDYDIDYIAPRLYARPDYVTYFDLFKSRDWSLKSLESSVALFQKVVPGKKKRTFDFRKAGMQTSVREAPTRLDWAREPTFYDDFAVPKKLRRAESQLAMHLQNHLGAMPVPNEGSVMQLPADIMDLFGACYLTLRKANEALAIDGNDDRAYYAMALAYERLNALEQGISNGMLPALQDMRMKQMIAAYRQSLRANPSQEQLCFKLYDLYQRFGKRQLALEMISQGLEIVDTGEVRDAKLEEGLDTLSEVRNNLREQLEKVLEQVAEIREQTRNQMQPPAGQELTPAMVNAELMQYCSQCISTRSGGLTLHAQDVLEEQMDVVQGSPPSMLMYGQLLFDNGELEEADQLFRKIEALAEQDPQISERLDWHLDASVLALIAGDSKRAVELLEQRYVLLDKAVEEPTIDNSMLQTLPLVAGADIWPNRQLDALNPVLVGVPNKIAEIRLRMALAFLEAGRTTLASDLLESLIEEAPAAVVTPLARNYYKLITDKDVTYTTDQSFLALDLNPPEEKTGDETDGEKPKTSETKPDGGDGEKSSQDKDAPQSDAADPKPADEKSDKKEKEDEEQEKAAQQSGDQ